MFGGPVHGGGPPAGVLAGRGARAEGERASRRKRAGFGAGVVESLEARCTAGVTATFLPGGFGLLTVFGDALNNTIQVSRNAAGTILVNGGAVAIKGGTATVANT